MYLFAHAFLAAGTALFAVATGRLMGAPSAAIAVITAIGAVFGIRLARETEPLVVIPFAVAGALLPIGGIATVFGIVFAMFAVIGFLNAKAEGIPWRDVPTWCVACLAIGAAGYLSSRYVAPIRQLAVSVPSLALGLGLLVRHLRRQKALQAKKAA